MIYDVTISTHDTLRPSEIANEVIIRNQIDVVDSNKIEIDVVKIGDDFHAAILLMIDWVDYIEIK